MSRPSVAAGLRVPESGARGTYGVDVAGLGDRGARFEALAHEVMEPLRRFLARRTDPATAEDVLADTLLVCWRRLEEVPAPPLPWVYAVARHCLANADRGRRRQLRVAGRVAALDPPAVASAPSDHAEDAALHEALARVGPQDAELLRLWAWEQLTPAEIAQVLQITPNAVSIRLHRARQRLRAELGKNDGAAGHDPVERRQP